MQIYNLMLLVRAIAAMPSPSVADNPIDGSPRVFGEVSIPDFNKRRQSKVSKLISVIWPAKIKPGEKLTLQCDEG